MRRKALLAFFGIFVIAFSCLAGLVGGFVGSRVGTTGSIANAVNSITQDVKVTNEESAVVDVADKSSKSVVSIVITEEVPTYENYNYNPFNDNSPFSQYFSVPQRQQTGTTQQEVGEGSGFIVSADGLIITNRHVVDTENASYTVILSDGTKYDAKVLAKDTLLDIAFVKIEAKDLTPLTLGTSSNLKVGQTAIAIGNALGQFSNTVSTGIISGLQRSITAGEGNGSNTEQLSDVIQTDASINLGNSGGPLLNINGEVIGVNVAIAENAQNVGFAIPIDVVKDLLNRLNKDGKIERPTLGVRYVQIDSDVKTQKNLSVDYGALVSKGTQANQPAIVSGSPAEKAGIKEGDIILEVDGVKVTSENTLATQIQQKNVGDTVKLLVLRGSDQITITVTLDQAAS